MALTRRSRRGDQHAGYGAGSGADTLLWLKGSVWRKRCPGKRRKRPAAPGPGRAGRRRRRAGSRWACATACRTAAGRAWRAQRGAGGRRRSGLLSRAATTPAAASRRCLAVAALLRCVDSEPARLGRPSVQGSPEGGTLAATLSEVATPGGLTAGPNGRLTQEVIGKQRWERWAHFDPQQECRCSPAPPPPPPQPLLSTQSSQPENRP